MKKFAIAMLCFAWLACGRLADSAPTGYWAAPDGGLELIVFDASGKTLWSAQHLTLVSIALELSISCGDYPSAPDGGIQGPANANTSFVLAPTGDGKWHLGLTLPPALVDSQYRTAGHNIAAIEGTVSAEFDGGLWVNGETATFSYSMSYRDSVKALEVEGGVQALVLSMACRI